MVFESCSSKVMSVKKRNFHCQLAHGSPTAFVSGFANIKELYQKIADVFEIPREDILYLTINTHKTDMSRLIGERLSHEDYIFAHLKGKSKEVSFVKQNELVGLTITDNGDGYVFVRAIRSNSTVSTIADIKVGDHIEKINNEIVQNKTHYEVGQLIREIPKGTLITFKLVEPRKGYFSYPESSWNGKGKNLEDEESLGVSKINEVLRSYLGLKDEDLAKQIWDLAIDKDNTMDFLNAVDNSSLSELQFSEEMVFELWGAITDVKDGRLVNNTSESNYNSLVNGYPQKV